MLLFVWVRSSRTGAPSTTRFQMNYFMFLAIVYWKEALNLPTEGSLFVEKDLKGFVSLRLNPDAA